MTNTSTKKFTDIKKFLYEHAEGIYEISTKKHIEHLGSDNLRIKNLNKKKSDDIDLIHKFADNLVDFKKGKSILEELSVKLAEKSFKNGFTLEEAIDGIVFLKQAFWEKLHTAGIVEHLTTKDFYFLNQIITTYTDIVSSKIAFTFNNYYNREIQGSSDKLARGERNVNEIRNRLAAIVESSDDAIISKSIDGFITSWNKGAQQLYDYTPEEVIGKPVSMLMPPDKIDDFPMIMSKLQQGKKIEHYETRRKTKFGKILDVSITVSPIRDTEGKIIGASKVARDITERKQTERRQHFLSNASEILGASLKYEITLKNLSALIVPYLADYCRIVLLDEKNRINEISLYHKNPEKISLVRELYDAYRTDKKNYAGVASLLKTGKSEMISKITPDVLKHSKPKVLELVKKLELKSYMGVPMKIGSKIIGAITFSSIDPDRFYNQQDLALAEELARRAAYALENARLYTESQKAVMLRDEFISVASHELKTPVTSLKMYVQIVKKQQQLMGNDTRNLEKMDSQVNKLTLLIQDLLNVSRLQTGKLDFHDDFFDLHEVINDVVDFVQPTTKKHIITINGTIQKKVWGDKERIGQVITNLLTNAIKYSPSADKVLIRLVHKKDSAQVLVQDFGIGIDKKHLSRIFERFYRVSDTEESTFPGLGLGLYISNEIIKRYGKNITVESKKGKGTVFGFTLSYTKQ